MICSTFIDIEVNNLSGFTYVFLKCTFNQKLISNFLSHDFRTVFTGTFLTSGSFIKNNKLVIHIFRKNRLYIIYSLLNRKISYNF